MKIVRADQVKEAEIFEGFKAGFVDYVIQMEMDLAFFSEHFFGLEGNERPLSFVAFDTGRPIGVVLGGLKTDESFKTLRCGAMAIAPEYRGTDLALRLFEAHLETARSVGCRQLFLEVIKGNDRAIRFYEKMGYEKTYDLFYRGYTGPDSDAAAEDGAIVPSSIEAIQSFRTEESVHLSWQGSFEYFGKLPVRCFGVEKDGNLIAGLVASQRKIYYLYVKPAFRLHGWGRRLLQHAYRIWESEGMSLCHANDSRIHTFCNHMGMERGEISQFEMMRWIG